MTEGLLHSDLEVAPTLVLRTPLIHYARRLQGAGVIPAQPDHDLPEQPHEHDDVAVTSPTGRVIVYTPAQFDETGYVEREGATMPTQRLTHNQLNPGGNPTDVIPWPRAISARRLQGAGTIPAQPDFGIPELPYNDDDVEIVLPNGLIFVIPPDKFDEAGFVRD